MEQLGLFLTDDEIKEATNKIKNLSDIKSMTLDDVDTILRQYHDQKSETTTIEN